MNKNIEIFETMPVPKAVLKFALPTVVSMIVAVFYNMVDAFFVGQTGDPSQFAAVNVATPVFMFLMAAGNIFGMGGSSFISRALGEKNYEKVKNISSFCLYAGIVTGILGGALILFKMPAILKLIGTTETTFSYACQYLSIIALGGPIIVLSTAYTNIVRGEGAAKNSMIGMMAGTAINIVLDPIFILKSFLGIPGLNMGVAGAAIATLIGNAVTLIIYLAHSASKNSSLSLNPKFFTMRQNIFTGVFSIGLPASLTNILMSLSSILTNNLLASYYSVKVTSEKLIPHITTFIDNAAVYGDIPTAAMGVALKVNMLAIFIQLGIGMGVSPLIAYNFGSKNYSRMNSFMKFAILLNVITGVALTGMYIVFAKQIINIFSKNPAVVSLGVDMIYALMTSIPFIGIMFVINFTFQAIGKGFQSLVLAVSRQGIVFLPAILLMDHFFGLSGIIFAQPIADAISVITAVLMFAFISKKFKTSSKTSQ
ncbi:MATE family efflux transporter [Treponema pectinovorum]|uniref:MATE family efflux transporter n=1 Tax=Treponema pectinovorum TaxID=164 RepID=UPI0011F20F18|nr:MATE family efflux transporter [Treponema pectinovorum]